MNSLAYTCRRRKVAMASSWCPAVGASKPETRKKSCSVQMCSRTAPACSPRPCKVGGSCAGHERQRADPPPVPVRRCRSDRERDRGREAQAHPRRPDRQRQDDHRQRVHQASDREVQARPGDRSPTRDHHADQQQAHRQRRPSRHHPGREGEGPAPDGAGAGREDPDAVVARHEINVDADAAGRSPDHR